MKLNDAIFGCVFIALASFVLWNSRLLPTIPGQDVGPAAFPTVLATLMAACGVALIGRGVRQRATQGWISFDAWTRSFPQLRNFGLVIAGLLFYVHASDTLGFHVCGMVILTVLLLSAGLRWFVTLPLAITTTLVIHAIFYKLLRVPLPWGPLPVLW